MCFHFVYSVQIAYSFFLYKKDIILFHVSVTFKLRSYFVFSMSSVCLAIIIQKVGFKDINSIQVNSKRLVLKSNP